MSDGKSAANGAAAGAPPRMPLFYQRPRPLDAAGDATRGLRRTGDFAFARTTNAIVLNDIEFPHACRTYPIVFSAGETRSAMVVLGLADGENLFVGSDGTWQPGAYIPAYARRYPFILMEQPGGARLTLCIDEASPLLTEASGERPLFENGQPSKLVQEALAFCGEFHQQHASTGAFVRALAERQLLVPNEARVVMNSGRQMTLRGFEVIDEAKFNALPDDVFLDWRRRGWLALVYCHLISMRNWPLLVELAGKRGAAG